MTPRLPLLALVAALIACAMAFVALDEQRKQTDPFPRIVAIEEQLARLDTRIKALEAFTPAGQARAEAERRTDELKRLRAGQAQIEAGQKLLCDATDQC